MGQPKATVSVSRESPNGEAAVPCQAPSCLRIASGGLRTTREASRFVNAALVDMLSDCLSAPQAGACFRGVDNLVRIARLEAAHSGAPVILVHDEEPEDPHEKRRRELLSELARLEAVIVHEEVTV